MNKTKTKLKPDVRNKHKNLNLTKTLKVLHKLKSQKIKNELFRLH